MTETWWCSELVIGKFPALYLFTRRLLPAFSQQELPTLYVPGYPELNVRLVPLSTFEITRDVISSAQQYTRRMFSAIHGLRMDQNKLDFSYLFLPVTEDEEEARWDERRRWMAGRFARSEHSPPENQQCANAAHLMEEFGSTLDWAMVRENSKIQRPLRFIGRHDGPIEPTEEVDLRTLYDGFEGPITYPLLLAQKLPNRTNFLLPRKSQPSGSSQNLPFLLIPRYTMVDLISQRDVTFSQILPSLLRWLTKAVTVTNLRDILFHSSPLQEIPLHTLTQAVTAPMSQEPHYQRLETLGDTVLKYIVGLQLFVDYPTWHEGYLAKRKDHAVNNNRLALDAVEKELYRWIIRDRLLSKKWVPRYFSDNLAANVEPEIKEKDAPPTAEDAPPTAEDAKVDRREERRRRRKKQAHELSTKVLADVVEALIGASYEHGGFDLAVKCLQKFGLGIPRWETVSTNVSRALSLVEEQEGLPEQFSLVERMLGYQFKRRMLLVEALTHPTYQGDLDNVSYERLEFLGDSALDMVVTDFLYHAPGKEYTPGKMHVRKEGLVNSHFLAYICLRTFTTIDADNPNWDPIHGLSVNTSTTKIHLWKCLLHSSPHVLEEQTITFASFEKLENQILRAFSKSQYYPWALLTDLQAPKFISDMVESILGAVFLDSEGDLNAVKDVMKTLGMFSIMERIVDADVYVLHPVSQLGIWAAQEDPQKKMRMEMEKKDGNISCTIFMDDEEVAKSVEKNRGIVTRNKVRFAAADAAIKKLVLNEEESFDDVDDVVDDWGNAWTDGPVQYEW